MLIKHTVENYKSLKNKTEFSMEAYMRDSRNKETIFNLSKGLNILPLACIYGQNASGKSNVIDSIAFLRYLVINSKDFEKKELIPVRSFEFDDTSRNEATKICIDFLNEERYRYAVSIKDGKVSEETLSSKNDLLFKRKGDKVETGKQIPKEEKNKVEFVMSLTNENSLLLSKCSQFNIKFIENAYNWFYEKLHPIRAGGPTSPSPGRMENALKKHGSKIIDMLNLADFGISNIIVEEMEADIPPKELTKFIEAMKLFGSDELRGIKYDVEHEISSSQGDSKKYILPFEEESDGTKKMSSLIISWIDALEAGGVLIIDELESCLHPLLVDFLISYFAERDINKNGAQLIFTTHDAGLAKRNKFRRDQVWFTARDPAVGATSLYSWLDYDIRSDLEFTDNYLAGRFGAIPDIKRVEKDI